MDPVIDIDVRTAIKKNIAMPSKKNFMILGSSGMLGGYFLEFLCEWSRLTDAPITIVAPIRKSNKYLEQLEKSYRKFLTLEKVQNLKKILETRNNWLVLHAASPATPERHSTDLVGLISTNIEYNLTLVQSLSRVGGHLVYLSSGEVYGSQPKVPTAENDFSGINHLSSRGAYAEAKRSGELIIQTYASEKKFDASILRVFHTFGPGIDINQSRIFSTALSSIIKNTPIELRTTGNSSRAFLYSADLVNAIMICANLDGFRVANVSGEVDISIRDFAKKAAQIAKVPILFNTNKGGASIHKSEFEESPVERGLADTTILKSLGWRQTVDLEQSLLRTADSVRWRTLHEF